MVKLIPIIHSMYAQCNVLFELLIFDHFPQLFQKKSDAMKYCIYLTVIISEWSHDERMCLISIQKVIRVIHLGPLIAIWDRRFNPGSLFLHDQPPCQNNLYATLNTRQVDTSFRFCRKYSRKCCKWLLLNLIWSSKLSFHQNYKFD